MRLNRSMNIDHLPGRLPLHVTRNMPRPVDGQCLLSHASSKRNTLNNATCEAAHTATNKALLFFSSMKIELGSVDFSMQQGPY